ncbi:MAG: glutamate-1-semialdehyde 2,1-aminomutase [Phycisphaerales bacterium]|jgi:glutamate-1-semialdehyde 2,1-aminomutase
MTQSESLYAKALELLPGGVSRNTVLREPYPPYAAYGEGCRLTDIEGVTRLDFSNNMASLLHGHACPAIVNAVTEQLQRGSAFTMATEIEVRYADFLISRSPSFEKIRFVNSGTEAIMASLKASRAFTGKPKIAKAEGAYHGQYDYAEVSQTPNPETWGDIDHPNSVPVAHGTPNSALDDVIIIPFNDTTRAIAILNQHKDSLACVLLDLMPHRVGLRPAEPSFVEAIREWTDNHNVLLVFDEVITFRTEVGGLQQQYNVTPDLTALGKAIGGGFPVGAIAGRTEVMDVMNPLAEKVLFPHSGTFSANPITLTAGFESMKLFDATAIERINTLAQRAIEGITCAIEDTGTTACVTGAGSMFRIHMKEHAPKNFREAYMSPEENAKLKILLDHMFDENFLMINTCSAVLSTPMTESEIDELVEAVKRGLQKL